MEQRAPSRAKATNILRPGSRAQGMQFNDGNLNGMSLSRQGMYSSDVMNQNIQQQQQQQQMMGVMGISSPTTRTLPGGARVITPFTNGTPMGKNSGNATPAGMRRPPSAAQFLNQQLDQAHHTSYAPADATGMTSPGRQRLNSYYEGMSGAIDPNLPMRSGSRADQFGSGPMQQQVPRVPSRSGRPNTSAGFWPGQQVGQVSMNTVFGGGFGSVGSGFGGAFPIPQQMQNQQYQQYQQYQQQQQQLPSSRPGSSLQVNQPTRPATSIGARGSNENLVVNVARGGARVIGPMRAKSPNADAPFLNPIPQSPPSAIGHNISRNTEDGPHDNSHSELSNRSLSSSRSRSNSAAVPTEESMEAAEARVSRKIQDLEISNKSLMAVNTQLESRVKSQREMISKLKKQLQLKIPFDIESADVEITDEAIRSALKEDKAFERLISNLEHLIQDAKDAIEYRSTAAAGKVISAAELAEGDAQSTASKDDGETHGNDSALSKQTLNATEKTDDNKNTENDDTESAENDKKMQEARELVARLMVLALSSPEPNAPERPPTRTGIPRRTGAHSTNTTAPIGRGGSVGKAGLRTPVKSASTRITSFGVASANSPVRSASTAASGHQTRSQSSASTHATDKGAPGDGAPESRDTSTLNEREQIVDICRKLQILL